MTALRILLHRISQYIRAIHRGPVSGHWICQCDTSISNAQTRVLDVLRGYIVRYDATVFSAPSFAKELPVRQFLISPSIDPLSDKNRDLPQEAIDEVLSFYG